MSELVRSGDQACREGQPETLSAVIRWLGPCVDVDEQLALDAIARLAQTDMAAARTRWNEASRRLIRRGAFELATP